MRFGLGALLLAAIIAASTPAVAGPPVPPPPATTPAPAPAPVCELAASVAVLATTGSKDDYLCVAGDPGAPVALVAALDALHGDEKTVEGPRNRYSRALALWLLQHEDDAWDPIFIRRLSADDRRLLSDGVHARRGRQSPAPEHDAIFRNLPWYRPDPNYNDARLTPADKAQIALADRPPPAPLAPPPPEPEAHHGAKAEDGATPSATSGICGCSALQGRDGWPLAPATVLLAALALLRRRRSA